MPKQASQVEFDCKFLMKYSIDIVGIFGFKRLVICTMCSTVQSGKILCTSEALLEKAPLFLRKGQE